MEKEHIGKVLRAYRGKKKKTERVCGRGKELKNKLNSHTYTHTPKQASTHARTRTHNQTTRDNAADLMNDWRKSFNRPTIVIAKRISRAINSYTLILIELFFMCKGLY